MEELARDSVQLGDSKVFVQDAKVFILGGRVFTSKEDAETYKDDYGCTDTIEQGYTFDRVEGFIYKGYTVTRCFYGGLIILGDIKNNYKYRAGCNTVESAKQYITKYGKL
jgi:hypothetical protein